MIVIKSNQIKTTGIVEMYSNENNLVEVGFLVIDFQDDQTKAGETFRRGGWP